MEIFHKNRDASRKRETKGINFRFTEDDDGSDGDGSSDEESMSEEAILNVSDGDNSSDEEESVSDEEEEEEEEEERGSRLRSKKLLKSMEAQKALLQRDLKATRGETYGSSEDEEEDASGSDESEGEEGEEAQWGRNKKTYYQRGDEAADAAEEGDAEADFDAREEEEAEARRIQSKQAARLSEGDFAFDSEDSDDEDEDGGGAAAGGSKPTGLSREEQLAAIERDAPELSDLLSELKTSLEEVKGVVQPALDSIREARGQKGKKGGGKGNEIAEVLRTASQRQGLSFIESKYTLMLSYCCHIVFYLLMKSEGRSVRDHPLLTRLVELRAYLEKIRPIEKKMNYQVQKLVAQATRRDDGASADAGEDPLKFRPNPSSLALATGDEDGLEAKARRAGVYVPPKIAPQRFEEEDEEEDEEDPERAEGEARRRAKQSAHQRSRALRSEYVQHLVSELGDRPEELAAGGQAGHGSGSAFARREELRALARGEAEEELFARTPMTKGEKKRQQAAKRAGLTGSTISVLEDLGAGELAGFARGDGVEPEEGATGSKGEMDRYLREKRSKKLRRKERDVDPLQGMAPGSATTGRSGDEDFPIRSLGDRRARHDAASARKRQRAEQAEEDFGNLGGLREGGPGFDDSDGDVEEDYELYSGALGRSEAKKSAKKSRKQQRVTMTHPPLEDERVEGGSKRLINYEIEKNRGLTPRRNKDLKNPRKKHRIKYQKALVRRKGQVQDQRERRDGYGGEATGIKSRVTKSVKL